MGIYQIVSWEQLRQAGLKHLCNEGQFKEIWTSDKGVVIVRLPDRKIVRIYSTINGKEVERTIYE